MICHHFKTVFVHIPKTAGQSVEHVFLDKLDLNWQTRAPLLLRENDNPHLGPPRLAHLKAEEYVRFKYLNQELFDQYFKFAYVRNPWSRLVSIYIYLGYSNTYTFKDFLKKKLIPVLWTEMHWFVCPQTEYIYSRDGELLVNYVGRFESLHEDFVSIAEKIGLGNVELPHVNGSKKYESTVTRVHQVLYKSISRLFGKNIGEHYNSYRDYYDQEGIDIVSSLYEKDIEKFSYSFDDE